MGKTKKSYSYSNQNGEGGQNIWKEKDQKRERIHGLFKLPANCPVLGRVDTLRDRRVWTLFCGIRECQESYAAISQGLGPCLYVEGVQRRFQAQVSNDTFLSTSV